MKIRLRLITLLAAVCLLATIFVLLPRISVGSAELILDGVKLKKEYFYGDIVTLPDAQFEYNGDTYAASCYVTFPDGTRYSDRVFSLASIGNYRVTYYAVADGQLFSEDYYFRADYAVTDLFEADNKVALSPSGSYKDYTGLSVSMSPGGKLKFFKEIDIFNIGDAYLVEMIAVPKTYGREDFGGFKLTLTDKYDPSNVVTVTMLDSGIINAGGNGTYIKANSSGQLPMGIEGTKVHTHPYFGHLVWHSFRGTDDTPIQLNIDAAERALYATHNYTTGQTPYGNMIIDLDDKDFYPSNPWSGFTTGEVYIELECMAVAGGSADFMLLSLCGYDMSGLHIRDTMEPVITIGGHTDIANGLKGIPYKLFPADALDNFDGKVAVSTDVYYNVKTDGTEVLYDIPIQDGAFIPVLPGEYRIVYSASDASGNVARRTLDVTVMDSTEDMSISFTPPVAEYTVGSWVDIAKCTVQNAIGEVSVQISVEHTDSGDKWDIENGRFFPQKSGSYEIIYSAKDYLGRTAESSYTFSAEISPAPVFDEDIVLPITMISGFGYELPQAVARDWNGMPGDVAAKVYVDGSLHTDSVYVPDAAHGAVVTIEYVFIAKSSQGENSILRKIYDIPVVKPIDNNSISLDKYFYSQQSVSYRLSTSALTATVQTDAEILFANPLYSGSLSLELSTAGGKSNFGAFSVYLVETAAPSNIIKVSFTRTGSGVEARVNGGASVSVSGSFDVSQVLKLQYDNVARSLSDGTKVFAVVDKLLGGNAFTGFATDAVYVKLAFEGVTDESSVLVNSINNQPFNSRVRMGNLAGAMIYILSDSGKLYSTSAVMEVSTVKAFDVLSQVIGIGVTVKDADSGAIVSALDGTVLDGADATTIYSVRSQSAGRYSINYTALSRSDADTNEVFLVYFFDDTPPQLTISGTVPASANVGDIVTLPDFSANDNDTAKPNKYVFLIAPSGKMTILSDLTFAADMAGVYYVRYYAADQKANYTAQEFKITVKGGQQ